MDILVDPREGSKPLVNIPPLAGVAKLSESPMPHGDVLVIGNDPITRSKMFIGFEVKRIDDFISSVQSNRLQQTQLPNMFERCQLVYLLVYGQHKQGQDGNNKFRASKDKRWHELRGGKLADRETRETVYHELELYGVHCYELETIEQVCELIFKIATLWSKPADSHNLMKGFDTSSLPTRNQTRGMRKVWKSDQQYNRGLTASILPDVGFKAAELASKKFSSPVDMIISASFVSPGERIKALKLIKKFSNEKDYNPWLEIKNIGAKTFDKVFRFLTEVDK